MRRKRRQRGWRKVARKPLFHCGACGRQYSNPFGHTCSNRGSFGKSKRKAERERVNARIAKAREAERDRARARIRAARARERAKADARVVKAKAGRPAARQRTTHDYRNCRDHDCERLACEAWREAYGEGFAEGVAQAVAGS